MDWVITGYCGISFEMVIEIIYRLFYLDEIIINMIMWT